MQYDDILKKLKSLSNPRAVEGMARFGINPENTYGVSIPDLMLSLKIVFGNFFYAGTVIRHCRGEYINVCAKNN